jgi:predicted Zn-dependent peptidase
MKAISTITIFVASSILAHSTAARAQSLEEFERTVTEHTLANGMRFLVVERHGVPVVSFHLYANVGSVDEETGETGMAHLFEHMAFKGTKEIGTTDYPAEKAALDRIDDIIASLYDERRKGPRADPARLQELEEAFEQAQEEAGRYVVNNHFSEILEQAGAVGLNASTSSDATRYFYSLPSNKVELWFTLESDRFLNPVLREFYKERDVVIEERRMRVDSEPVGNLLEDFLSVAYKAHPYGREVIGWQSDLENLTRPEASDFFSRYYTPPNLTAFVVGDVQPAQVIELAELYFGRIPFGPAPEALWTVEPPQQGERRTTVHARSQPLVLIGYHKPSITHPDDVVFDAAQDILAGGRTSRLYRSLVEDKQIAMSAGGFPGFPGNKYPNLFLFHAFPTPGHTNEENEQGMLAEIERLKTELVSEEELQRAKSRARARLVAQLDSNSGLASQLATYQVLTGDWRNRFRTLDAIERVTREDIQRVANTYFTARNRTVGYLLPEEPGPSAEGGAQ